MSGDDLIKLALDIYTLPFEYLKKVKFVPSEEDLNSRATSEFSELPSMIGEFSIPYTAYLKDGLDTGHFNWALLPLCYNQMTYTYFVRAFGENFGPIVKYSGQVSLDAFFAERQLPDSVATDAHLKFRKFVDATKFYGQFYVDSGRKMGGTAIYESHGTFWDDHGGKASADVRLALIDPSKRPIDHSASPLKS